MTLLSQIEAILFVSQKPLSLKDMTKALNASDKDVRDCLEELKIKYNHDESGIHILFEEDRVRMATNPACADVVDGFIKYDASGELTKAQLETLTVIAYRGPVTRPELEQIRGVNCAVILRHLLVRGLIEEREQGADLFATYVISFDALAHLGIDSVEELPEYGELHAHEYIETSLSET